ncbi:hypothetical protein [Sediminispirochaeta bajacaliforniensis]|uniref:hypothetical protein n=1 Tax=Sediminispirochaeta bajacaliforniensis TaxID=148 RepID=UPI0003669742|nr:hypothetical protein [Sediminispirochaeta bajacaliforniensis]
MKKTIKIILIPLIVNVCNLYAEDNEKIDQLERDLQELKNRISKIETMMINSSESDILAKIHEGWKSVRNWRIISTIMSIDDVRNILGEPQRNDGGDMTIWHYENYGSVTF